MVMTFISLTLTHISNKKVAVKSNTRTMSGSEVLQTKTTTKTEEEKYGYPNKCRHCKETPRLWLLSMPATCSLCHKRDSESGKR